MRQILFRGKRLDNGEWVKGSLFIREQDIHGTPGYLICAFGGLCEHVDPATIGQYTGLKDKHGKRIFESDCAKIDSGNDGIMYGEICFKRGAYFFEPQEMPLEMIDTERCFEVIGNIHDKEK